MYHFQYLNTIYRYDLKAPLMSLEAQALSFEEHWFKGCQIVYLISKCGYYYRIPILVSEAIIKKAKSALS